MVTYEELEPLTDARRAVFDTAAGPDPPARQRGAPPADPGRRPRPRSRPTSWSSASTRSACRTRPSSVPSPGWPCRPPTAASTSTSPPSGCTSTRPRSRPASGLPEEKVRLTLAGVGGAFGAREDLSMQVHACLLALHTGKPVRMVYGREESFFGHVHRHPAWMRYEHGADRDGTAGLRQGDHRARRRRVRLHHQGGGRQRRLARRRARTRCRTSRSTPTAPGPTTRPAARCAASARCRPASRTSRRWTRWPHELGLDPVEIRVRNAVSQGSVLPTGQVIDSPAPLAEMLRGWPRCRCRPARPLWISATLPGGYGNTTHGEGVRRGVGYGVGHQEHLLLRGLRRLLHRPGAARGRRPARRWPPCTPPPPRSARAWSPCSSRSPGPSSAWRR